MLQAQHAVISTDEAAHRQHPPAMTWGSERALNGFRQIFKQFSIFEFV